MPASSNETRTYAAAHFALELGPEKSNGTIKSVEGGGVKVDVMTYQHGGDYERWRQAGKPHFDDLKLQVGMSISEPYYDWLKEFFAGTQSRKDGAIVAGDFYYTERARREFKSSLLKEVTIPALDGASKDALYMGLTLAVENIVFLPGKPGVRLPLIDDPRRTKLWKAADFRLNLGPLDTSRVTKIDSFTIKQTVIEHHVGGFLAPTKTPSQIDFPNITFYIPESHSKPFIDQMMTNAGDPYKQGKAGRISTGSIEFLGSDHSVLATLNLVNCEIIAVTPDKADATSENTKLVKVEMYCEGMTFQYASITLPPPK